MMSIKEELQAFTDRELLIMLNSVHERGMFLLDHSCRMSQAGYRSPMGKEPSKEDIDKCYNGHKEHLELVDKLRNYRTKGGNSNEHCRNNSNTNLQISNEQIKGQTSL